MSTSVFAQHRAVITGLYASVFAVAFASIAIATAMPAAAAQLGQISLYAWAFSLFVMATLIATVLAGRVSDRRGPVIPLVVGLGTFATGLILAAVSVTMPMLLVARALQGFGGGFINLSLMVLVAHLFTESERPVIMTGFSVCWVLPAFIGPPIAAWITTRWSWHLVFLAVLPLLALAVALGARPVWTWHRGFTPEPSEGSQAIPVRAAVVAAVSVALIQSGGQQLGSGSSLAGTVAAAVLGIGGVAGIWWAAPLLMPAGFTRVARGLGALVWTRGLQAGAFFAAESFLPLSLIEGRQLSLGRAGFLLTIGSVGWMAGSWLQSRPWVGLRRDQLVVLGAGAGSAGLGVIALGTWFADLPLVAVILGWVLAGLGMGLAMASGSLALMILSPKQDLGRNSSSLQVAESLGTALIVGLAGSVFAALHLRFSPAITFGLVFVTAAVLGTTAALAARRIGSVQAVSD